MAISLETASKAVISVARPAPIPRFFVGVFTAMKTMSASLIVFETSVEKKRLGLRDEVWISSLNSAHWLSHSDVAELADETLSDESNLAGSLKNENAFEPSLVMRMMFCSPGS